MGTISLLVILLLMAVLLYYVWRQRTLQKNRKDAIGHIWAEFYTSTGDSYGVRCPVKNNRVVAPASAQESLKREKGEHATYLIRQDKTFNKPFPPGKPAWSQTKIPSTAYYEGNPEPIVSRDPKTRLEAIGTAEFFDNLDNEKMTELMVQFSDEMKELREQAQNKISAKAVYGMLFVLILTGIVNFMFVLNALDGVTKVTRYWGL